MFALAIPSASRCCSGSRADLFELLDAAVDQRLDQINPPEWNPDPAVCVVMASEGYPGKYETGRVIRGLEEAAALPNVKVFHAGTATNNGDVVTAGGRVLGVTASGSSIPAAKLQAYRAVKAVRWLGAWCPKRTSLTKLWHLRQTAASIRVLNLERASLQACSQSTNAGVAALKL
jgi:phosphoribosylamine--glycine ligase (EC 6.3.4.13)